MKLAIVLVLAGLGTFLIAALLGPVIGSVELTIIFVALIAVQLVYLRVRKSSQSGRKAIG